MGKSKVRKARPRVRRKASAPRAGNTPLARTLALAGGPTLPVGEIKIGKRFRKDFGDLNALAASIDDRGGLIHAIPVTPGHALIAGERRLKAWKLSRFKDDPIPIRIIDIDSIVAGEWDENAPGIRKDFTLSECVAIAAALKPIEKAKAVERMRAHGKTAPGRAGAPDPNKGNAADKVARLVGVDRKTLQKAEAVVEAARESPRKFGNLLEQMDRTGRAHGPFKRLTNMQQSEAIRRSAPPLPGKGPYDTGVIDWPWASEPDGAPPSETGRGYFNYPTMTTAEMIAFGPKVRALLNPKGAWIWNWVTNFHLVKGHAFEVLDGVFGPMPGYSRVHIRTGFKDKIGRGQVLRGQTEHVILIKIGNPRDVNLTNQTTAFDFKVRADSQKPDNFYDDVEALTPARRYFELFSRRKMPKNWDGHGDQVGKLGAAIAISPADAHAWQEANRIKTPAPYINGGTDIAGNFLATLERKAAAGEIAWRKDGAGRTTFGKVGWFGKSDFRNCEFGMYPSPRGFVGGITVYRTGSKVDVGHFNDASGCGYGYSCIPIGQLKKFMSAWAKASTSAPAEPFKAAA